MPGRGQRVEGGLRSRCRQGHRVFRRLVGGIHVLRENLVPASLGVRNPRLVTHIKAILISSSLSPFPTFGRSPVTAVVFWGHHSEVPQSQWLPTAETHRLSGFGKPDVWDQVVSRAILPLILAGGSFLTPASLLGVAGHLWRSLACNLITQALSGSSRGIPL